MFSIFGTSVRKRANTNWSLCDTNSSDISLVTENHLCRIRDVIVEDITVIVDWKCIMDAFLDQAADLYTVGTMIDDRKRPVEFILETLRIWQSRCGRRATMNTCIWKFRQKEYINIAGT